MNMELVEQEMLEKGFHALRTALEGLSVVTAIDVPMEPHLRAHRSDATLLVETTVGRQRIEIEAKTSGEPRFIREASFVLSDLQRSRPGCYGIVLAPYISPESREILRRQGQGWFDLAGNCLIRFDGVHLEIVKTDFNPFSTKRKQRSIFSPKSGRVLKLLLSEARPLKGIDIASRTRVSAAQVSKVREALIDREWAVSDTQGLRISQPAAVLEAWRESKEPPKLLAQGYTLKYGKSLDTYIEMLFMKAQTQQYQTLLLAAHSVARRVAPFARVSGEYFYVDSRGLELIQEMLSLEKTEEGANVFIYEPDDDMLTLDAMALKPEPLRGTGLIQTYLDLSSMGERGREAADHLLASKSPQLLLTSRRVDESS
jgi:hypothetical protein